MDFIPDQPQKATQVPFYDDATSADGWQGQATGKSIEQLKSELVLSLSRLGATVTGIQKGVFDPDGKTRLGYRVRYFIEANDGQLLQGKIDIASLPVRGDLRSRTTAESQREKSLKMALYMLKISIDGLWFLRQLSPGYAPLMPFMLGTNGKTISQMWIEQNQAMALPEPIEGEFKDL